MIVKSVENRLIYFYQYRKLSSSANLSARKRSDSWHDPEYSRTQFPPIPAPTVNELGEPFRRLEIMPKNVRDERYVEKSSRDFGVMPPRWTRMKPTQDWTSVWPTAHSFKASAVPLPIRMGFIKDCQLKVRLPPGKHANLELMKIPNFLHLTPAAIEKHCKVLREKFCTKFPEKLTVGDDGENKLTKNFPVEITTQDFVFSGPSLRDPRSRIVNLRVCLKNLPLDEHARWKFIKLVGDRYDKKTDTVTIVADRFNKIFSRCPARHQNKDYAFYLLSALFHQSWKVETWESELDELDRVKYMWQGTKNKKNTFEYLKKMASALKNEKIAENEAFCSPFMRRLSDNLDQMNDEKLDEVEEIEKHKNIMEDYFENGETHQIVKEYSASVRRLLGVPDLC
uniref:Ribosomal protein S24/S35 mitochondrial conserved domain-containing protein n=1 Tax=Romanomermis culicivorax TaxID=13658 RepID=A0A915K2S3_ROMCU